LVEVFGAKVQGSPLVGRLEHVRDLIIEDLVPHEDPEQSLPKRILTMHPIQPLMQGVVPQSQVLHIKELIIEGIVVIRPRLVHPELEGGGLLVLVGECLLGFDVDFLEPILVHFLFLDVSVQVKLSVQLGHGWLLFFDHDHLLILVHFILLLFLLLLFLASGDSSLLGRNFAHVS